MPKIKTNRSAAKRFRPTKKGRFKRERAYASHLLSSKTKKQKRHLRRPDHIHKADERRVRKMLPYSG